jgi:hypothetical protein
MLPMKWMPLFVLTALVTGFHNFYGLMGMVNGSPINLLNCVSLLGSAMLLGAAVLLSFRQHTAAKLGFLGSLLCWVYYAPVTFASLVAPFSAWSEVQFDLKFHEFIPVVGRLVGPILLILCTATSIILLRQNRTPERTV